jgi:hypothetical protein
MFASAFVYAGIVITLVGLLTLVRPIPLFRIRTRRRALTIACAGMLIVAAALAVPSFDTRAPRITTRLDEFVPAWQFHEVHSIRIKAPPDRVFDAIKTVTADEILFFRTLTWIRRGGRPLPTGLLNASDEPLIDVALKGGFVRLAEERPREIVIGTVVVAPGGARVPLTPELFRNPLPGGSGLAAMNFLVTPDGAGWSILSTETRVFANSPSARRKFAAYWRLIYPGSAIIRRMWLRAIARRVTAITGSSGPAVPS